MRAVTNTCGEVDGVVVEGCGIVSMRAVTNTCGEVDGVVVEGCGDRVYEGGDRHLWRGRRGGSERLWGSCL